MSRNKIFASFSKKAISESATALLVFLFLYTALSKLLEIDTFREVLGKSPLLGSINGIVAWSIPVIELLIVTLLIIPKTRYKGLWASLILLSIFTLYLIYMVIFTPELPCSCGGVINNMTWTEHIFFNLAFIGLSTLGIYLTRTNKNKSNSDGKVSFG